MGRTYCFECVRCGYRAKVSGGADRGFNLLVQTIFCRNCRALSDAVTAMKVLARYAMDRSARSSGMRLSKAVTRPAPVVPPRFSEAVNRLLYTGGLEREWLHFKLQCPVSPLHKIEPWKEPGKCPRCGLLLEKNTLPFRIWD
jgi:hypothetical protein